MLKLPEKEIIKDMKKYYCPMADQLCTDRVYAKNKTINDCHQAIQETVKEVSDVERIKTYIMRRTNLSYPDGDIEEISQAISTYISEGFKE